MDYNVTAVEADKNGSLFSANVNIIFSPSDFVFLAAALTVPVIIYFAVKFITKK